jgi:type III secretory pathway component EscV
MSFTKAQQDHLQETKQMDDKIKTLKKDFELESDLKRTAIESRDKENKAKEQLKVEIENLKSAQDKRDKERELLQQKVNNLETKNKQLTEELDLKKK